MFDLGRRRRHLQTSRLSIDSGDPAPLSVDQLFSILYASHQIIQGSRGAIRYSKIPWLAADNSSCQYRTLIGNSHLRYLRASFILFRCSIK